MNAPRTDATESSPLDWGLTTEQAFSYLLALFVPLMLLSVSDYIQWCKQSDTNITVFLTNSKCGFYLPAVGNIDTDLYTTTQTTF